jgi:hypothetical protein
MSWGGHPIRIEGTKENGHVNQEFLSSILKQLKNIYPLFLTVAPRAGYPIIIGKLNALCIINSMSECGQVPLSRLVYLLNALCVVKGSYLTTFSSAQVLYMS